MNIFKHLAKLARSPTNFFKIVDSEPVSMSILAYTIIILISTIITVPISALWQAYSFGGIPDLGFADFIVKLALTLAQHLVSVTVMVLIIHCFSRALKGDGAFGATVKAVLYPSALLGLVFLVLSLIFGAIIAIAFNSGTLAMLAIAGVSFSIISLILAIWGMVLFVKGIKVLHSLSTLKAVLAGIVLPFLVFIIIGLLFGATIIALIGGV